MSEWTPDLVEARLAEAAFVLRRLPEPRRQVESRDRHASEDRARRRGGGGRGPDDRGRHGRVDRDARGDHGVYASVGGSNGARAACAAPAGFALAAGFGFGFGFGVGFG